MTPGLEPPTPTSADSNDRLLQPALTPIVITLLGLIGISGFSSTVVNVLVPQLSMEFGEVQATSWTITGFLLTSTLIVVIAGGLIDTLGLRVLFRWTVVLMALSSLACAVAPDVRILIAMRAVQGVAAGVGLATAIATIGLTVPERIRVKAFAANAMVWGLLSAVGPLLAITLSSLTSWRSLFLLNAIMAVALGPVGWNRLPGRLSTEKMRLDLRGLVLLSAITTLLTVGFATPNLTAAFAGGATAILLALYWRHSGRHHNPILDRTVLITPPLGAIHFSATLAFGLAGGLNAWLPIYIQAGLGQGPLQSAVALGSMSIGWTGSMVLLGRWLAKLGESRANLVGYVLVVIGVVMSVSEFAVGSGLFLLSPAMFVLGAGTGSVSSSMFVMLQRETAASHMGRASSGHQFLRGVGQTGATALVAAIVFWSVTRTGLESSIVKDLFTAETATTTDALTTQTLRSSVRSGFVLAGLMSLGLAGAGLATSWRLHRRYSART
jgi:MFS family permease